MPNRLLDRTLVTISRLTTPKLERNITTLLETAEGARQFEDLLSRWIETRGREPTRDELEIMTTVLCRTRSGFHRVAVLSILMLTAALLIKGFVDMVIVPTLRAAGAL